MALPPIIANLPVFKLFKTAPDQAAQKKEAASAGSDPRDVVDISEAARQRLEELDDLANEDQAARTATETRGFLAEDPRLTLGLPPGFVA